MKSIQQASPVAQTSCLEGFHSVLNHFAPKMIHYSYVGMYCRHILATIHFNNNLRRDVKMKNDGSSQINVVYPKFKNGEGTARDVRVKPKFEYVDELFESVMLSIKDKDALSNSQNLLKEMSSPPMNVMLQKQPRSEVLLKQVRRKCIVVNDVPPSIPATSVPFSCQSNVAVSKEKCQPKCLTCKKPMKGHKHVADCPKNRKT
ncbi:uncharacterized protein LOC124438917 isoform X2 [Xenia sp. Carnegie-2017]|uniref:uncharacterized protein LOC124438917 isoform X2 n=1 Tax=Xenia sp. Carnegie-2017 TaxID=2897299 RepID=UPI001F035F6B|nr:uncharacterized protein LOC124438917 isoform X2 [Xenia sp. Carnegie-2017]